MIYIIIFCTSLLFFTLIILILTKKGVTNCSSCKPNTPSKQSYSCETTTGSCRPSQCVPNGSTCVTNCSSCKHSTPSQNKKITMTWSGGNHIEEPFSGSDIINQYAPFEISQANIVALASVIPSSLIKVDPVSNRGYIYNLPNNSGSFSAHITNYEAEELKKRLKRNKNPNKKYILSFGGSATQPTYWNEMMNDYNNNQSKWLDFFTDLFNNFNITGIDWDFEGLDNNNSEIVVNTMLNMSALLKSRFQDYLITCTVNPNLVNTSSYYYTVLKAIKQYTDKNRSVIDYITLMLYAYTMFGLASGNSYNSWSKYLTPDFPADRCSYRIDYYPENTPTIAEFFSGVNIILAVTLFQDPNDVAQSCDNKCLQGVFDILDKYQHIFKGIAIWCYGAFANECQCQNTSPYFCKKMAIIDLIFASFQNSNKNTIPTNEIIKTGMKEGRVIPTTDLSKKDVLDEYGCCPVGYRVSSGNCVKI